MHQELTAFDPLYKWMQSVEAIFSPPTKPERIVVQTGLNYEDALFERLQATERVVSRQRHVHEDDIERFAHLSGDHNSIHMDDQVAKASRFKGAIAHGMLTAAFISARIGEEYPGCIYVSQTLFFTAPVYPWDTVFTSIAPVREEKRRLMLACVCRTGSAQGTVVLHGDAMIRPAQ